MAEEGETQKPNIAARERGKTKVENSHKSRRKVGSLRVGAAPTKLSGVIKSIQNQSAFLLYSQRPLKVDEVFSGRRFETNDFYVRKHACFRHLTYLSNHNSIPLSLYHFCIHEILWL